jgi:plasmid stability protein
MGSKNLTLAIDEALLDRARVLAAIRRTSVNDMVREFLIREVDAERQHDEVKAALLKLATESEASFGGGPFVRDDAYTGNKRFDRWS